MQIAALNIDERYRRRRLDLDCPKDQTEVGNDLYRAGRQARVREPPHCVVARVGEAREPKKLASDTGVRKTMLGFAR